MSIHAKCGAVDITAGRTLICWKSKGHADPEHYDPDADRRWGGPLPDTRPELGTLKVGDPVLIIPPHNVYKSAVDPIEATVTKVARLFVTLTETNSTGRSPRTWRMRMSTQHEDSNYSHYDRFVTPDQYAWDTRQSTARQYLFEVGVSIDSRSPHRGDTSFSLTLANLLRAHFDLDPI